MHDLNEDTYIMLAMKAYDKPNLIMSEFEDDLRRIKYVKRLIKRYKTTSDLKERLILNHIIILSNVFGVEMAVRLLFFRIDKSDWDVLKTFLIYLRYMPKMVTSISGSNVVSADVGVDLVVGKALREL